MHRNLAALFILKSHCQATVEPISWEMFQSILDGDSKDIAQEFSLDHTQQPQKTRVLFHWTFEKSLGNIAFSKMCLKLQETAISCAIHLRCLPNLKEILQARAKVGDMKALNAISTISRLKTCYPGQIYSLQGEEETIHKRANSCGKEYVLKVDRGSRRKLACFWLMALRPRLKTQDEDIWFHQELSCSKF